MLKNNYIVNEADIKLRKNVNGVQKWDSTSIPQEAVMTILSQPSFEKAEQVVREILQDTAHRIQDATKGESTVNQIGCKIVFFHIHQNIGHQLLVQYDVYGNESKLMSSLPSANYLNRQIPEGDTIIGYVEKLRQETNEREGE